MWSLPHLRGVDPNERESMEIPLPPRVEPNLVVDEASLRKWSERPLGPKPYHNQIRKGEDLLLHKPDLRHQLKG